MKQVLNIIGTPKKYFAIAALLFFQSLTWAQDKKVDVTLDVNKGSDGGQWYTEPWMWVVGGAIFIIIIVAILSGRGGKD